MAATSVYLFAYAYTAHSPMYHSHTFSRYLERLQTTGIRDTEKQETKREIERQNSNQGSGDDERGMGASSAMAMDDISWF